MNNVDQARRQAGFLAHTCAMKPDDAGVSSAAFSTTPLPQINAGKTFQAKFGAGVFAAMINAATPHGCRRGHRPACGVPLVIVRPKSRWPSPAKKRAHCMAAPASPASPLRLARLLARRSPQAPPAAPRCVARRVQDIAALHPRHGRPFALRGTRGPDGGIDVGRA